MDIVTGQQLMFVEPTPNALPLQLVVEPTREDFVIVAVGDEARIELNCVCLPRKRGQVFDECVGKPDATKERQRQVSGTLQSAKVDRAGTRVANAFQILTAAQIDV